MEWTACPMDSPVFFQGSIFLFLQASFSSIMLFFLLSLTWSASFSQILIYIWTKTHKRRTRHHLSFIQPSQPAETLETGLADGCSGCVWPTQTPCLKGITRLHFYLANLMDVISLILFCHSCDLDQQQEGVCKRIDLSNLDHARHQNEIKTNVAMAHVLHLLICYFFSRMMSFSFCPPNSAWPKKIKNKARALQR